MADSLEFNDITAEIKGAMCPGRLKLTDQNIIFKSSKAGKMETISVDDLDVCNWQKLVGNCALRLFLKNGTLHRYCGFKDSEQEKVAKYFKKVYSNELLEKELSVKGWNWGSAKFNGSVLSFEVNNLAAFEIPLSNVSQCTPGKNEVAVEFHQNDDAAVNLMEMRFHIPTSELAGDDPVEAFHALVMKNASVISVIGDAIAIFREIQCLTPRGRYDIKIFSSFFQLHGKTFDYKIPMATVQRLFLLPHKDGRQMFYVVSLDPPIKQGQTRYHYLVFLFGQDEETSVELPFTDEELAEKYEGKLEKELSGATYEVISRIMKALVNRKITVPGGFIGHSGTPAVGCSYKAAAGYLYPLERGFIYVHKPPIHIRFDEIGSVNLPRSGGTTKSFDLEIELKRGVVHTFSSIEKEEYGKLYDFINSKKIHIKNKKPEKGYGDGGDFDDSDEAAEPDVYLERVKREAEERDEGGSSDESEDEDFKPGAEESDVAEEFDSNPSTSESEGSDASGAGSGGEKKKKVKKEKKKKTKSISEKPRKRRTKKEKDENKPKRAPTAYMLWFNDNREKIKADNPGASITDIAKKAGDLWKKLTDRTEWESKAAKLKEEYAAAMKEYRDSGKADEFKAKMKEAKKEAKREERRKSKETTKKIDKSATSGSPSKAGSGKGFISKEFIEDSDSSSNSDAEKKPSKPTESSKKDEKEIDKKKKLSPKKEPKSESEKSESEKSGSSSEEEKKPSKAAAKSKNEEDDDEEDEESASTPSSSEDSD